MVEQRWVHCLCVGIEAESKVEEEREVEVGSPWLPAWSIVDWYSDNVPKCQEPRAYSSRVKVRAFLQASGCLCRQPMEAYVE